jgi:hypothetical protein
MTLGCRYLIDAIGREFSAAIVADKNVYDIPEKVLQQTKHGTILFYTG